MTDAFVSVRGVTRRFGQTVAVEDASLDVARGELVALLGPSGCGKTTLLRMIGGLEVPDAGEVSLEGRTLSSAGAFVAPEKRGVVMVFQDFALFPHMTVGKNVAFGLKRGASMAKVAEVLELVGLAGLERRMPHELSGGQQQRVALARALAPEPGLILLDEPFSNLDPAVRQRVRGEVRALLKDVGITAIFVTHDQDEALSLADRVAVMFDGRIVQVGTPAEIYTSPARREVAEFLGHPSFIAGEVRDGRVACALGSFETGAADGPCDVMVRAEDVRLDPAGVAAEVVAREYFGHEVLVRARLASGESIRARWRPEDAAEAGDSVRLSVPAVRVFEAAK